MNTPDPVSGAPALWPRRLEPVFGPFGRLKLDGAQAGMGDHGQATVAMIERGLVPPDMISGMTLWLLARQPKPPPRPRTEHGEAGGAGQSEGAKASAIEGNVWVQEQFTVQAPLSIDEPFVVHGESTGRYVRNGRRYGTTISATSAASGAPVAANFTTGLFSYRAHPNLANSEEGQPLRSTPRPRPNYDAAANNPHRAVVAATPVGTTLGGTPITMSLAMMAARDTTAADNPIHSDPAAAARAGLRRPIAGGSHVLAMALELLMAHWGDEALLHGTHTAVRWLAPTEADTVIVPTATVAEVTASHVRADLTVTLAESDTTAMTATVTVPIGPVPADSGPGANDTHGPGPSTGS